MKPSSVALVATLTAAFAAAGCRDDDPGTRPPDSGTADSGTGSDTNADVPSDAGVDPGDDVPSDTHADLDSGGDVAPDSLPDPVTCEAGECELPQACVGGTCVDPVEDIEAYASEAALRRSSYFWSIQLPALYPEPDSCCFDYTGDGRPDDALGSLVAILDSFSGEGEAGVQAALQEAVASGAVSLVVDWGELPDAPGDVRFVVLPASNDLDADDAPDQPFDIGGECPRDTRCGGDGTFALDPAGFGTHGPLVQFNVGTTDGDAVHAGPTTFPLDLPIAALGGESVRLTLTDARIDAAIDIEPDGVHTVDETRNPGSDEEHRVGGGRLGGVIDAAELLDHLDRTLRGCACAGVDPEQSVLVWELDAEAGSLAVSCTENVGDETNACDAEVDDPMCATIATVCGFVGLLGSVADVDRDVDGINESLSVGLRFAWTGAAIDGLVVAPKQQ